MEVLNYIAHRRKEILMMLEIDRIVGADPYDDVARLKELEGIEKILKQKRKKGETEISSIKERNRK